MRSVALLIVLPVFSAIKHSIGARLLSKKERILSRICAAVLSRDAFISPCSAVTTWLELLENFWCNTAPGGLTVDAGAPAVQSRPDAAVGGKKKRKKSSLPLSPERSWMPVLSLCNTGEFNSYPDNVVNQLEVLVPWGYSH